MNTYAATYGRGPGRASTGIAACGPVASKVVERLPQCAGRLSLQGLAEPGLVFGYRQIALGERLTKAGDDVLPLAVATPDAEIGAGGGLWGPRRAGSRIRVPTDSPRRTLDQGGR